MGIIIIITIIIPDLKNIPKSNSPLVIAEIAQAHEGSLGIAHSYIDAASNAGVDAVKFQTHIASAESTLSEPWRVKFSNQDATRYDYWKRMEFSKEQWKELYEHSRERNMLFISSPFSIEAVELLLETGIDAWKVASGELNNTKLFEMIAETGLPVFVSTGMSNYDEIDKAVEFFKNKGTDLTLMQCTSLYPTPAGKTGLNLISEFRERYHCNIGLSDHSGNIFTGLAACALGANTIEVHITFSKESFGPDVPASITIDELKLLTEGVKFIFDAINNPVDKNTIAEEFKDMKKIFNKSIVARYDLKKGSLLDRSILSFKKPGNGLSPDKLNQLIGKRLKRDIKADELIMLSDIE